MKKRIGSIALAVMIVIALLAVIGCNNQQTTTTTGSTTSQQTSSETTVQGPPTEVTMVFCQGAPNIPDLQLVVDEISKISEQEANVKFNLVGIPFANYSQQIMLMLTGHETMDLFVTGVLPFENLSGQLANNQLAVLDDYVEQFGEGIVSTLGDYLDVSKVNGHIYAIPTYRDMATSKGILIDKAIADKYNLDAAKVKTLTDLEPFFAAIKNGETETAAFNPCSEINSGLDFSFGLKNGDALSSAYFFTGVLLDSQDVTSPLVNFYETAEAVELFKLARKWNQAGYIMPGIISNTDEATNLLKAGKVASYLSSLVPGSAAEKEVSIGRPVVEIYLGEPSATSSTVCNWMWAVPNYSKVPDASVKFLNLMFTNSDVVDLFNYGIPEKHYVIADDGRVALPEGIDRSNNPYSMGMRFLWGNRALAQIQAPFDLNTMDEIIELNNTAIKSKGIGFMFDPTPVKTEFANCVNVHQQYAKALGTGSVDPDVVLPEYLEKLKAAGCDVIIAEKQSQFNEFLAANNIK